MINGRLTTETLKMMQTGGSTGKALDLMMFRKICSELRTRCRVMPLVGLGNWVNPWRPGNPIRRRPKKQTQGLVDRPNVYLDTMALTEINPVRGILLKIGALSRPTLLFGHAHRILLPGSSRSLDHRHPARDDHFYVVLVRWPALPMEGSSKRFRGRLVAGRAKIDDCFRVRRTHGLHMNIEHLYIEFLRDDGRRAGSRRDGEDRRNGPYEQGYAVDPLPGGRRRRALRQGVLVRPWFASHGKRNR